MNENQIKPQEIIIIECTYCLRTHYWNRQAQPNGFGYCGCKTSNFLKDIGKDQQYKVLKEHPKHGTGHVIVLSCYGKQKLYPPYYRENPNSWEKT